MTFKVPPPSRGLVVRVAVAFSIKRLDEFLAVMGSALIEGGDGFAQVEFPEGADVDAATVDAVRRLTLDALHGAQQVHGYGVSVACGACPDTAAVMALRYFSQRAAEALAEMGASRTCPFAADGFFPWSADTWEDAADEAADVIEATL